MRSLYMTCYLLTFLCSLTWADESSFQYFHSFQNHPFNPPSVTVPIGIPITGFALYSPFVVNLDDAGTIQYICVGGWRTILQLSDTIYCGQLVGLDRVLSL